MTGEAITIQHLAAVVVPRIVATTMLLLGLLSWSGPMLAQQAPTDIRPGAVQQQPPDQHADDKPATNPPPVADSGGAESVVHGKAGPQAYVTYKTPYEFWLTGLAIALVVILGSMLCIMAALGALTPEFYKAFLILVVVFSALFLIVAGYTDQQTAPVFSLLGTIAGYIFGRSTSPSPPEPAPPPLPDAEPAPVPPRPAGPAASAHGQGGRS